MKQIIILLTCVGFMQIAIGQNINFPDANFKSKLVSQNNPTIDTNNDDEISISEANAVTGRLRINGNSSGRITDLSGIEYFVNATEISANDNELTTVDLSSNTGLIIANFNDNDLVAIDFSNNTALEEAYLGSNNLGALDFSSNINLKILGCTNMLMTSLNVNNCTQLEELNCAINQFTSLDLSTNTALKTLIAHSIPFLSIDVSNNLLLETLDCRSGEFSTLDVSNNAMLIELECSYGQVSNIIFGTNNGALTSVECQQSVLTTLDVSALSGLTSLVLNDNLITALDVSQNTNLEILELDDNQLTTIDLETNINLNTLKIETNQLQSVYLRSGANNVLTELRLRYNPALYCLFVDNPSINYGNWYRGGAVTLIATEAECDVASQVTIIPDIKFEIELISQSLDTSPANGEIPTSKINTLTALDVESSNITDLTGIEDFVALVDLDCGYNNIDLLDVSNVSTLESLDAKYVGAEEVILGNNPNLTGIDLRSSNLVSIDVSGLSALTYLELNNNDLTTLDVTNNLELSSLHVIGNPLTVLDLRNNNIRTLKCWDTQIESLDLSNSDNINIATINPNPYLTYVNFKSGGNENIQQLYSMTFHSLPNLVTACVDDVNSVLATRIQAFTDQNVNITEDCLNQVTGNIFYDLDNNGCDSADITVQNIMIESASVVDTTATFTSVNGNYVNYVSANTYLTSLESSLPDYFALSPESQASDFTEFNNIDTIDFCIEATQTVNDVNISLIPINPARPGFNVRYQIVYNNIGTTQLSGSVTLNYDESMLNFLNANTTIASQTSNSLTFDYTDLNPFESRTINLQFNVFPPPTVNGDDVLLFTAEISPVIADNTTDDNVYFLRQIVVNSYDPNDKQVLQGSTILEDEAANYLDYIVRFQNTGTASAIYVRIEDVLDQKLDWTTLQPMSSSHDYRVEITNDNRVAFIYDNIILPPQSDSEELSQGYIAFRLKPKSDVLVGDIISGTADIYFDFNAPIITNTVSTEIVAPLSINEFNRQSIKLFPNPAQSQLNITSNKRIDKLSITDINGRLLSTYDISEMQYSIDISSFSRGVYFIKIHSGRLKSIKKFIKN